MAHHETKATAVNRFNQNQSEGAEVAPRPASRRKAAMLAVLLLVFEAAIVVGAFSFFNGPQASEATPTPFLIEPEPVQTFAEVLVFDDRLYNDRLGTAFEYRVKIAVKVLEEDRDWVAEMAGRFAHELHMELDTIWRSADPRHLREVDKRTLTNRVRRMLEQWVNREQTPASGSEASVIHDVVVVPSPGIRINR